MTDECDVYISLTELIASDHTHERAVSLLHRQSCGESVFPVAFPVKCDDAEMLKNGFTPVDPFADGSDLARLFTNVETLARILFRRDGAVRPTHNEVEVAKFEVLRIYRQLLTEGGEMPTTSCVATDR